MAIESTDSRLVEVRIDGERPGVGVLAIQVMEALRRLGVPLVAEEGVVPAIGMSAFSVVSHAQLRDALDEVLAEGNVDIAYVRRNRP